MNIGTNTVTDGYYNQVNQNHPRSDRKVTYKGNQMIISESVNGTKQERVFEDFNHDGHFDPDEIIKITRYSYSIDGGHTEMAYLDSDHDGFIEKELKYEYDINGRLLKRTVLVEENTGSWLQNTGSRIQKYLLKSIHSAYFAK